MSEKISIRDIERALKVFKAMHKAGISVYDFDAKNFELETGTWPDADFDKARVTDEVAARRNFATLAQADIRPS